MAPPWNDDWSDDVQLTEYLLDLIDVRSPLIYGLYDDGCLVGASIGNVRHWCRGTEYFIEEFFIKNERQHSGLGTEFFKMIESSIKQKNLTNIFLMTDSDKPAFDFYKKLGFVQLNEHVSFFKNL